MKTLLDLINKDRMLKRMKNLGTVRTQYEIVASIINIDDVAEMMLNRGPVARREERIMDVFSNEYIATEICKDLNERSKERYQGGFSYVHQCRVTELRPVSGLLDDVWDDRDILIRFKVVKTELTEADFWDGDASACE